jgi:6,7-dimethyl-8-ribityllumazine synthase
MRVALVVGRFYEDLAHRLVGGARAALDEAGAESGRYAAVVCLGAVVRGETSHYDYVCGESARGIQDVQLETGVPCSFGVLTVDNLDQALARSGGDKRDSGRHAAEAVLALVKVKERLAAAG